MLLYSFSEEEAKEQRRRNNLLKVIQSWDADNLWGHAAKNQWSFSIVMDTTDHSLLLKTVSSFGLSLLPPISPATYEVESPHLPNL